MLALLLVDADLAGVGRGLVNWLVRWGEKSARLELVCGRKHHLVDADGHPHAGRSAPNLIELDDRAQGLALLEVGQGYGLALRIPGLCGDRAVLGIRQNLEVQSWRVALLGTRLDRGLVDALCDNLATHLLAQKLLRVKGDEIENARVECSELLEDLRLVEAQRQRVADAPRRLVLVLAQAKWSAQGRKLKQQLPATSRVQVDRLAALGVLAHIRKGHVSGIECVEHLESHLLSSTIEGTQPFM